MSGSPEFGMTAPNISRLGRFLSDGLLSAMENSGPPWSFQRKGQIDIAAQGGRGHGQGRLATFPGNFSASCFQGKNRNLDPVRSSAYCPLSTRSCLGYPTLSHRMRMAPLFQMRD